MIIEDKSMNTRMRTWPHLAAALVVAVAIAVVWGVVLAWAGSLVEQWWQRNGRVTVTEWVPVLRDGTPVIFSSHVIGDYVDSSCRTLDGQPLELEPDPDPYLHIENLLQGAIFEKPIRPPELFHVPIHWRYRIADLFEHQRPRVYWYGVLEDAPLVRAYFVGYDALSKLRVGYIGRSGFRRSLPPKEEWFDLANCDQDYELFSYSRDNPRQRPGLMSLVDGDRLLEIDLLARSVQTIFESPGLLGWAMVQEPPQQQADNAAVAIAAPAAAEPTSTVTTSNPPETPAAGTTKREPLLSRIAVRTPKSIVILDPPTGEKREYPLPELLRDKWVEAYAVGGGQLLLLHSPENDGSRTELMWLKPGGEIAWRETVTLASYSQPKLSERQACFLAVPVAPIPIGWLGLLGVGMPIGFLQSNEEPTYAGALMRGLGPAWPALAAVLLIGAAMAWWTYRLQQKYHRPATGLWCAFVFLLGPPGLLAYRLEQRRAKLETCPACDAIVPRDREACAACDALFPAPPPVGTEIFA
jgi:hypothetical protein